MSLDNWLTIISIIVSTLLTIVSLWIAISSLKVTSESVFEANRPYIAVTFETFQITKSRKNLLMIKNYGRSGALIKEVSFSPLIEETFLMKDQPFDNFKNVYIAPTQKFTSFLKTNARSKQQVTCTIKYEYLNKLYTEQTFLNFDAYTNFNHAVSIPSKKTPLKEVIARASAETIKQKL